MQQNAGKKSEKGKSIPMKYKKNDLLLVLGLLVLALLLYIALLLFREQGARVIVTVDGTQTAVYSLSETVDTTIKTAWGENHLQIKDGVASVTDADCRDKLCVHQKAISRNGESIICLPHKLVISIEGAGEKELDGVVSKRRKTNADT